MTVVDQRSLSYDRLVDRALVHRRAVMEVFVTDSERLGEDRWAIGVQAPRAHAYYNDQLQVPATIDPLLLLEACRQAVTVPAHGDLGIPLGTSFLISSWRSELTVIPARADAPDELVLLVTVRDLKKRGSRPLGATFEIEFTLDGATVGHSEIVAGYLTKDAYQAYRQTRRGSLPPLSSAWPERGGGRPTEPAAVGRRDERNVVLSDVTRNGGRWSATVDVLLSHPAMFDHPLDHIPAMVLLEAARQAAVLAVPNGSAAGFSAAFHQFVELDAPTRVEAVAEPDRSAVMVEFWQQDALACAVTVAVECA